MNFFRYDSEFMQALGRAADMAWLNILCFLCSIPIFTIGAAISAKYYVAMKIERNEAPVVTKSFFKAFKQNFVQDTKITFVLLIVYVFFGIDWYLVSRNTVSGIQLIFVGMLAIFTAMLLLVTFCIFPLVSRFEMKTVDAFRNALVFGIAHIPRVILGLFMAALPFLLIKWEWYFKWFWLIWLGVESLALYYNSRWFIKRFDKLEEQAFGKKTSEEDDRDPDAWTVPELESDEASVDASESEEISESDSDDSQEPFEAGLSGEEVGSGITEEDGEAVEE